jgi:hypothetical protein
VIADRSGPLDLQTAKPLIVRLATLEGLEVPNDQTPHITLPLDCTKRIVLISPYSWAYMSLTPEQVNFADSTRHIGFAIEGEKCWLCAPDEIISKFTDQLKDLKGNLIPAAGLTPQQMVASRLADRLNYGFCLQRFRLQTGDETVAFYRGPFTLIWMKSILRFVVAVTLQLLLGLPDPRWRVRHYGHNELFSVATRQDAGDPLLPRIPRITSFVDARTLILKDK